MGTHPEHTLISRPYNDERDLRAMQGLLMAGRSRTDDWRYWHIGDLMDFFILSCHLPLADHIRLWHDATGDLVAYAILGRDPSFDCQVLPEYAWSGIEDEALAWAETRLAALRTRDARRWDDPLTANARRTDARRIAFLEEQGFRRGERVEISLLRSLDVPIPASMPPTGYEIRAIAGEQEAPARGDIERELWPAGDISDGDYARLMRLPGYDRELDVVAVTPEDIIAAYVNNWLDPVNRIGVCGPVGTRAAHRRRGIARATLLESLHRQRARGMDRACISTGQANTPARQLYESLGFTEANAILTYAKPA